MNQTQKNLLCKMLNDKAKAIQNQLEDNLFIVKTQWDGTIDTYRIEEKLSQSQSILSSHKKEYYLSLKQKIDKLASERDKLQCKLRTWCGNLKTYCYNQISIKNRATSKLNNKVQEAIVEVQFAENAEQAKEVLNSLPTVDQLLGEDGGK